MSVEQHKDIHEKIEEMKTAEEILENIMCCTIEEDADLDVKSNYYYQHDDVIKAQKEAYNEALEDAVNPHEVDVYYDENVGFCIVQQSILKLKK